VVIGGSSGIGLETARTARAAGAGVIITGRNPERLAAAARDLGADGSAAFDIGDRERLDEFLRHLPKPVDHIMICAGRPYYAPLAEMDFDAARRNVDEHFWLALHVAREAAGLIRPGGSLVLVGGTGGRKASVGLALVCAFTAAMPALTRVLALEIAPIRVNLVAPGFVDTPLSADLLGDDLDARRQQLRETLPIRRVVGPGDVGALAVHLMANTALTGGTYDVDGGQQLL
jgi:NAD(P)-dependent dehydrogenase (short-subunit alcohol dehydrogenase family)